MIVIHVPDKSEGLCDECVLQESARVTLRESFEIVSSFPRCFEGYVQIYGTIAFGI